MGTDIHPTVQIALTPGKWRTVVPQIQMTPEFWGPTQIYAMPWAIDPRNYSAFAMLADIRNGVGFAGIDMGDRITPLHEHLGIHPDDWFGLPDDCGIYDDEIEHTPFSVTLRQLIDARRTGYFDRVATYRGLVDGDALPPGAWPHGHRTLASAGTVPHFVIEESPRSYCGDTNAGGTVSVQWDEPYSSGGSRILRFIDELTFLAHGLPYGSWQPEDPDARTYETVLEDPDEAPGHYRDIAHRVRLVAWFDS